MIFIFPSHLLYFPLVLTYFSQLDHYIFARLSHAEHTLKKGGHAYACPPILKESMILRNY